MPSETERAFIVSRVVSLKVDLQPATEREVLGEYSRLLADHAAQPLPADAAKLRAIGFVEAVSGLPIWAVREGCRKWRRGEGDGNHAFAPTGAQIRPLAEAGTFPYRAEITRLERTLSAKPIGRQHTPESRERVARKFGDLLKSMTEDGRR